MQVYLGLSGDGLALSVMAVAMVIFRGFMWF